MKSRASSACTACREKGVLAHPALSKSEMTVKPAVSYGRSSPAAPRRVSCAPQRLVIYDHARLLGAFWEIVVLGQNSRTVVLLQCVLRPV